MAKGPRGIDGCYYYYYYYHYYYYDDHHQHYIPPQKNLNLEDRWAKRVS